MRPVVRGPVPLDADGRPKTYARYADARGNLIEQIGEYCSYCEMHLDAALAVEHIQPKAVHPELEREWSNFLLACPNCNSTKGDQEIMVDDYFWPHRHNTFLAITYSRGGVVHPNPSLSPQDALRADKIIKLVGLDKEPRHTRSENDRRWLNRQEAWGKANLALIRWRNDPCEDHAQSIVELVASKGYWSIWMTVFKDEPEMLLRFLDAIPGTARECFDEHCAPRPRNGDQI
jgi:uncharacterized protein (TIGR02646 family)